MNVAGRFSQSSDSWIGLLNTAQCRGLASDICAFENEVFGVDFACSPDSVQAWFESGCLFCAALFGEPIEGRPRIQALVSALLTSEECRHAFLDLQSSDVELVPWLHSDPTSRPSLYFASVIGPPTADFEKLYSSLGLDLMAYLDAHRLTPQTAFAVASSPEEQAHMMESGFLQVESNLYLGKYPFMTLNNQRARTGFWQQVLSPEAGWIHARSSSSSESTLGFERLSQTPESAQNRTVETDFYREGREVERRLAESKRERYRHMTKSY